MTTASLRKASVAESLHGQIKQIQAGLSFRAVQSLQKALELPAGRLAELLGMSRATFQRRKVQGKLDRGESEKLARYQRLLARAEEVFGDAKKGRQWLRTPRIGLADVAPLEFAASEIGAREVENLLGRIEFGVYS